MSERRLLTLSLLLQLLLLLNGSSDSENLIQLGERVRDLLRRLLSELLRQLYRRIAELTELRLIQLRSVRGEAAGEVRRRWHVRAHH